MIKKILLLHCLFFLLNPLSAMHFSNSFALLDSDSEQESLPKKQITNDKEKERSLNSFLNKTLFNAAKTGDLDTLKKSIAQAEEEAETNDQLHALIQSKLQSPLLEAACWGHLDCVHYLLEKGADINAEDQEGCTPLGRAAGRDKKDIVLFLLEKGADVNAGKKPALIWATGSNHLACMDILLKNGASNQRPDMNGLLPIHTAIIKGNIDALKKIIARANDLKELQDIINAQDTKSLRTPLMWVARMANKQAEKLMISHSSETSLALRDILLSYGANPKIEDKSKKDAYFWFNKVGIPLEKSPADSENWRTAPRSQGNNSSHSLISRQSSRRVEPLPAPKPGAYIPPSLRNK